jgi:hypothetical protein
MPNLANQAASAIVRMTEKQNNEPKDADKERREEEGKQMARERRNTPSSGKK